MRRALLLLALAGPVPAAAAPRDILFWAPYAAGSPEQAAETMATFARYVEAAAGWGAGSCAVEYRNTEEPGMALGEAAGPGFLIVPMPIWLRHHAELGWRPLLKLVTDAADGQRYTLYGPAGSALGSLEGAPIQGDSVYDVAFVSGVVLGRAGGPAPYALQPTSRSLSAVRRAVQGEKVMVLLDEAQRLALASLPGGGDLQLLAESPWMPAGVLVATPGATAEDAAVLVSRLRAAADDPSAKEILTTMKIRRFDPIADEELASLGRSYASARPQTGAGGSTG